VSSVLKTIFAEASAVVCRHMEMVNRGETHLIRVPRYNHITHGCAFELLDHSSC